MAKVGIGNVLGSYAQSAGWKALNQLVNSNSRFGIFDKNGNAFYEAGLKKTDISILNKILSFATGANGAEAGIISMNYNKNYSVTTAPVEGGNLVPINLVEQPRSGQVTYVATGTEKQRKLFEEALEKAGKGLTLYVLHTAERLFQNIKITGYSISRSATQGTQLVHYQINFQEILPTPKSQSIQQAKGGSNDSQSLGTVETQSAKGNQVQAASKKQ